MKIVQIKIFNPASLASLVLSIIEIKTCKFLKLRSKFLSIINLFIL